MTAGAWKEQLDAIDARIREQFAARQVVTHAVPHIDSDRRRPDLWAAECQESRKLNRK